MKLNLVVSLLILFTFFPAHAKKTSGTLVIEITKIKRIKGSLKLALLDRDVSIETKEELKKAYKVDKIEVDAKTMSYKFEGIPFGEYSFNLFHDENNNTEMDLDLFDIPVEGFAYSNNPKIKTGKPSFKKSAFKFTKHNQKISVKMMYL